ncbi:unnamed protein product [Notodromas monacha]|nr:unnamed protein product [Notodromas monacha]CAG0919078.1 unnamed protein product [Notodromas monacha]
MCRALNTSMMDSLVTKVLTPEKLLMEPAMLVALLHVHIGCEVGANFVEMLVKWFDELHSSDEALIAEDRRLDNIIFLLCHLQNFKVLDSTLMYDVLKSLCRKLSEKDVELILIILRTIGFSLRKQDANAMKEFIVEVKAKATEQAESYQGARIKFMLEALLAVKNNNALKMPNYDPEPVATMQKTLRMLIQGKTFDELKISLRDLLDAEKRGKWWVVGSAWTGKLPGEDPSGKPAKSQQTSKPAPIANASKEILELARKQRMNTEVRKNVFCIIMTSDDFMDAFEKLIKLGLNKHQDRELVVVSIDCCLQEKVFNPFYAHLVNRLCEYDRRFQLATQFSFWDRVKALKELEAWQLRNLARLFAFLFLKRGLPISVLKAIQFSDLDKKTLRLVRQILMSVLLTDTFDQDAVVDVFLRISQSTKLNELRESLKLFMHHFLLKNKSKLSPEQADLLEERVALADKALASGQKKFSL